MACKQLVIATSLIFLITTRCFAQQSLEQIDNIVNTAMQQDHIPGLALAVMVDGKPLVIKGYGNAAIQPPEKMTVNTLFAIGSVSKVITSFAIMMLVEQGKVGLDESVLKYIPKAPKQWQAVTIRQLLSHSSGIPQHQGSHLPWLKTWRTVGAKPMEFQPGTNTKYNNFGYIVLGRVIENVGGLTTKDYFQQKIFNPLSMEQTGFPNQLFPVGLATGYRFENNQMQINSNRRPWLQMWGSGGIVSTINDMAKWDAAMTEGQLLSSESYRQLWTPVFLKNGNPAGHKNWAWSLGWQVSYQNNKLIAEKDGAIRGYSSRMTRHIDEKISVIILTNTNKTHLKKLSNQIYRQVKQ